MVNAGDVKHVREIRQGRIKLYVCFQLNYNQLAYFYLNNEIVFSSLHVSYLKTTTNKQTKFAYDQP